jgi:hypothetical protein
MRNYTEEAIMKPQCEFTISLVKDGKFIEEVARMHNTTLYTGYDLLAAMATSNKYINGMYIEYKNSAPSEPTISPTRDRSYYAAYEDGGYAGDQGYARVPLTLDPVFTSTGAEYAGNKATLVGVTDPTAEGIIPVQDGVSQFFTVALVHIPDINDASQDIVYNAAPLKNNAVFTPITKVANIQIGVQGSIKFEETP